MLKKLLISILLATFLLTTIFVSHAKAQENWYNPGVNEWYTKVYDDSNPSEIFGERYASAQVNWIIWSVITWIPTRILGPEFMVCALSGNVSQCVKGLLSSGTQNYKPVVASVENEKSLLASIFEERSFSGITYFKNIGRKFNLIPEAKAQVGFGFTALNPILTMWKASRNIAYVLFILIMVVLAFMIMFRVKISPQVVISAQSALPKIVIALLLVTFSYAIAGFLIDLMYVAIGVISLFGKEFFPIDISPTTVFNFLTKGQPFNIELQLGALGLFIIYTALFLIALVITLFASLGVIQSGLVVAVGYALSSLVTISTAGLASLLGLAIVTIIGLVLLWMLIKTLWMLIKAYASILLLTIFAPLQIAFGALVPTFGFTAWIKSFVSNLAVFVVTGVLFLLSFSFLSQGVALAFEDYTILGFIFGTSTVEGFKTLLGTGESVSWPPLLGFGTSGVPLLLLGASFVIFTLIPSVGNMVQSIIQGKPFAYGTAIGETVMGGPRFMFGDAYKAIREAGGARRAALLLGKLSSVYTRGPGSEALRDLQEGLSYKAGVTKKSP